MTAEKEYRCFLTGYDSSETQIIPLHIYDPLTNTVDTAYISTWAYKHICKPVGEAHGVCNTKEHDQLAAQFWMAYKQADSAGYTDSGFVSSLKTESRRLKFDLFLLVDCLGQGAHFCLMTEPLGPATGNLRLWCKNRFPVPSRVLEPAEAQLRTVISKAQWEWLDHRWLIATPPDRRGNIERAQPPWNDVVLKMAQDEYGSPPDLFAYIGGGLSLPGYELVRRALL